MKIYERQTENIFSLITNRHTFLARVSALQSVVWQQRKWNAIFTNLFAKLSVAGWL